MASLNTTVRLSPLPAGKLAQSTASSSPPGLLRCAIVSPSAERLDGLRFAAEQETWKAVVCKDANEMLRCAFRECLPLSIIDMPAANSVEYESYRSITERICELGGSNRLLVIFAATQSVQEEIWARQLGVWSYIPLADLSMNRNVLHSHEESTDESKTQHNQLGLTLVFGEARKALAKLAIANANSPGQWDLHTPLQSGDS